MPDVVSVDAEHLLDRNIISVCNRLLKSGEEMRSLKLDTADEIGFGDIFAVVNVCLAKLIVITGSLIVTVLFAGRPSQVRYDIVGRVAINVVYLLLVLGIGNERLCYEAVYLVVLLPVAINIQIDIVAYIVLLLLDCFWFQHIHTDTVADIPES